MVIYTHPSDIPPSPREPADPFSGQHYETIPIGMPSEEILVSIYAKKKFFLEEKQINVEN